MIKSHARLVHNFTLEYMVKGANGLPVQEMVRDPEVTDNEYEERVLANYAAKPGDYEIFADENVTAEYSYHYRETMKQNKIEGVSYKKMTPKKSTNVQGPGTKKRRQCTLETVAPVTKPLSVVVHRLSQREIDLPMNKSAQGDNTLNIKFVDHLWSKEEMMTDESSNRWVTTKSCEDMLEMTIY